MIAVAAAVVVVVVVEEKPRRRHAVGKLDPAGHAGPVAAAAAGPASREECGMVRHGWDREKESDPSFCSVCCGGSPFVGGRKGGV